MKILGIDYGTKRIGLAISDETQTLARELDIVSPENFWKQVNSICQDNTVSEVIVGLPLGMSGQDTEKTQEAREFATKLHETLQLPVGFMDERLSSMQAEQITGQNEDLDSMAAQIILQSYLDKKSNTKTDESISPKSN